MRLIVLICKMRWHTGPWFMGNAMLRQVASAALFFCNSAARSQGSSTQAGKRHQEGLCLHRRPSQTPA